MLPFVNASNDFSLPDNDDDNRACCHQRAAHDAWIDHIDQRAGIDNDNYAQPSCDDSSSNHDVFAPYHLAADDGTMRFHKFDTGRQHVDSTDHVAPLPTAYNSAAADRAAADRAAADRAAADPAASYAAASYAAATDFGPDNRAANDRAADSYSAPRPSV